MTTQSRKFKKYSLAEYRFNSLAHAMFPYLIGEMIITIFGPPNGNFTDSSLNSQSKHIVSRCCDVHPTLLSICLSNQQLYFVYAGYAGYPKNDANYISKYVNSLSPLIYHQYVNNIFASCHYTKSNKLYLLIESIFIQYFMHGFGTIICYLSKHR